MPEHSKGRGKQSRVPAERKDDAISPAVTRARAGSSCSMGRAGGTLPTWRPTM